MPSSPLARADLDCWRKHPKRNAGTFGSAGVAAKAGETSPLSGDQVCLGSGEGGYSKTALVAVESRAPQKSQKYKKKRPHENAELLKGQRRRGATILQREDPKHNPPDGNVFSSM